MTMRDLTGLGAPFATGSTGPRAAVQIEQGELDDFQRSARLLLAHPLVTITWPRVGALAAVRRWEVPLCTEFARLLGYRLDVGRASARLYRRAATTSVHRGPMTHTGRAMGRLTCSFLCLTLAALEGLGDQTTASRLSEEVLRLRSGDDTLPVDLTQYDQRKAFVDAVKWLEDRGVLRLCDGTVEQWLSSDANGDALYDVDRDCVSRLLVASPSVLRDVGEAADFLVDDYSPTDDAQRNRVRHRVGRRLIEGPLVSYEDLDADELAYVRHRRTRVARDLETLTGCVVESRAEGLCLIDAAVEPVSAERFPGGGTLTQAALLCGAALVDRAIAIGAEGSAPREALPTLMAEVTPAPEGGRVVTAAEADAQWEDVVARYGTRFKAEYREAPDRLHREVIALLERFGLIGVTGRGVVVHAALARYRPATRVDGSEGDDGGLADAQLSMPAGFDDQR